MHERSSDGRKSSTASHNTASNKTKVLKTPGGKVTVHYRTKSANGPKCGDCGASIQGVPHLRPHKYRLLPKREKNVTRAYGGSRCSTCVRQRIVRAFLVEEQKIVKHVLKSQAAKKSKAEKAAEKK